MAAYSLETYGVWAQLAINCICFIIYILVVSKAAWSSLALSTLGFAAAAKVKAWIECFRVYLTAQRPDDPFERKVQQLATEARVDRGRALARIGIHVLAALVVFTTIAYGRYDFRAYEDAAVARRSFHQGSFVHMTAGFVMFTYCWLFPQRTTTVTYNICHAVLIARLGWQACTSRSVYELFSIEGVGVGARFLGAITIGTPSSTLSFNLIYAALKVWMYSTLFHSMDVLQQDLAREIWGDVLGPFGAELWLCASLWCASTIVESWNYSTVRANLQAKTSSANEETVKSILNVMCDSVVTVDKDLVMNTPSSDFAHFLVRYPLNNSYQGVSFLAFVEQADRQRIHEQLTKSLVGPGTANSLSTSLVDGNGASLKVQMYCTCFIDVNGDRAYVIGIIEVRDRADSIGRGDVLTAWEDVDGALVGIRGTGELHPASEPGASLQTAESGESAVTLVAVDHNEYEAFVDFATESWLVVATSLKMRQLSGPWCGKKRSFVDWLPDFELTHTVATMTKAFENFRGGDPAAAHTRLGRICFRPPHAAQAGLECVANVTMDLSDVQDTCSTIPVCLRFTDVELRRWKRRRPRGTSATAANTPVVTPLARQVSALSISL
eukprot:TRINITY_DN73031_c0_g1_i2.p1 TRINITY_DN73031_c0_g1~~TRINITY_DN73031_c0_g1_i2.p1  ORF type:complete len:610 (+),score=40.21 TRINITY_DN73031_c0_g1_i2:80-1909(+)